MDRLFNADSSPLRILARRPNVLLGYIVTLNNNTLLTGNNTKNSAGGTFMLAGYNFNRITFLYM
jgi:hypothetical protein